MAHVARLRKVGGSVMLAIPPHLLDELDLKPDATVDVSIRAGKLTVAARRRRFTLAELIAQCDPKAKPDPQDREWLDAPPVGRELI